MAKRTNSGATFVLLNDELLALGRISAVGSRSSWKISQRAKTTFVKMSAWRTSERCRAKKKRSLLINECFLLIYLPILLDGSAVISKHCSRHRRKRRTVNFCLWCGSRQQTPPILRRKKNAGIDDGNMLIKQCVIWSIRLRDLPEHLWHVPGKCSAAGNPQKKVSSFPFVGHRQQDPVVLKEKLKVTKIWETTR